MTERETELFYAESWALVHYLTFGKPELDFNKALTGYLADKLNDHNPEIKVMLAQMYVAVGRAPEARRP